MVISIEKAEYKGDYVIKLQFSDGIERDIDFGNFLQKAKNPMTKNGKDHNKTVFQDTFIIRTLSYLYR